jgi:hypothetical protein
LKRGKRDLYYIVCIPTLVSWAKNEKGGDLKVKRRITIGRDRSTIYLLGHICGSLSEH